MNLSRYRKSIAAACGFLATAATGVLAIADVVPESAVKYVLAVVSVLTLASVYQVPNAGRDGRHEAGVVVDMLDRPDLRER